MLSRDVDLLLVLLREADESESRIRRTLGSPEHTAYLAMQGEEPVGAAVVRWQQASEIEYIAVAPTRRRQGVGTALMSALWDEARRFGVSLLLVGTDNTSMDNIAFYQKCGFRIDSVRHDYFEYISPPVVIDGIALRDMVVLSRRVDAEPAFFRDFSAISQADDADVPRLFEIWESSARATHQFLSEADFQALIPDVKAELAEYRPIYCLRSADGTPYAMLGVRKNDIEMLFVHADHRGRGAGRLLIEYAVEVLGATTVDVNEDNTAALGFYKRMGFAVSSRSDSDGDGRPFPMLHLALLIAPVVFRDVTKVNFRECVNLSAGEGQPFVESNLFSLAEAKSDAAWQPKVLYVAEQPVGFLMYSWDAESRELYLARLMIDVRYQGRGYGPAALKKLIAITASQFRAQRIRLSVHADNARAIRIYERMGFRNLHRQEGGEQVYGLELFETPLVREKD